VSTSPTANVTAGERARPAEPLAPRRRTRRPAAKFELPLAPSLERRRLQTYLVLVIADAVVIALSYMFAGFIYLGRWFDPPTMLAAQLVVPIFWSAAILNQAYSVDAALDARVGIPRALLALSLSAALLVFVGFYINAAQTFSRVTVAMATITAAGGLAVARDLLVKFARWHCGPTGLNTLVIRDGGRKLVLPHSYAVDAAAHRLTPDIADPHALNRIGLFMRNMDRVVVSCAPERRRAWAMVLKGISIQGEIVDESILDLGAIGARRTPQYAALIIAVGPLRLTNRVLKRALDLTVALLALLILSPVLLAVALAIKLEDGGPVIFVQRRLGYGNRFFPIFKFRSMRQSDSDTEGASSTARGDMRVTRVGRFIRATSIDELPQLINVLVGHMSLVGPRPHALGSQAGEKLFWEVDDRYWQRHVLKPGLTGLAQVRGLRGSTHREVDLTSRLQADLEYIEGWTIWRDIGILIATLRVIVHRNAF
jgi:polysaccharide biosynthesis protein PslA